jgi:hypothetical protein
MRFETHISCLACDFVKQEMKMLPCGHNICIACFVKHESMANMNNVKGLIRCEVCSLKCKYSQLHSSIANKSVSAIWLDI